MRAPDDLIDRSRTDPAARAVLIDWFEEQGDPQWSAWLRSDSRGEVRKGELIRALKRSGLRLREADHRWFQLDEPFKGPFLQSLSWTVRDPARLTRLLALPPFARATRFHLASWRPRSAVPTVLAELSKARPALQHLDVLDVPVPLEAVAPFTELQGLAMRLEARVSADLPVRTLCIRTLQPADLEAWLDVRTPQLESLEIRRVPGPLTWDPSLLTSDRIAALLDRPFRKLSVDRSLFGHYRETFDRHSRVRVALLPPRRALNEPPEARWSVLA